jgi:hypothetical protein
MPTPQALIEKIRALPQERLQEVEDFIDFIGSKARRLAALDRLLAIAPALEEAEVDAVRAERRLRRGGGADRS